MAQTHSKACGEQCACGVGSPSGLKCRNPSIRRPAHLIAKQADATSPCTSLACLLLGPLDQPVSLQAQLNLVLHDQGSEGPQRREKVQRFRLALELEGKRMGLPFRGVAAIRECLGARSGCYSAQSTKRTPSLTRPGPARQMRR